MRMIVVAPERPAVRVGGSAPMRDCRVFGQDTGNRRGAEVEEIREGRLYHAAMRDKDDGLANMLLPDAVQGQLYARRQFDEALSSINPLKEGTLRVGDVLPARGELFLTQRA